MRRRSFFICWTQSLNARHPKIAERADPSTSPLPTAKSIARHDSVHNWQSTFLRDQKGACVRRVWRYFTRVVCNARQQRPKQQKPSVEGILNSPVASISKLISICRVRRGIEWIFVLLIRCGRYQTASVTINRILRVCNRFRNNMCLVTALHHRTPTMINRCCPVVVDYHQIKI